MSEKYFIGIDPGKHGAIAIIDEKSENPIVFDCPLHKDTKEINITGIVDILTKYSLSTCTIEKSQAMPGQGVTSMFNYGKGYGIYLAILECLDVKYSEIRPQSWKKEFQLNSDKQLSITRAKELFPELAEKLLKSKDGRAEALLLAEYARRKYLK